MATTPATARRRKEPQVRIAELEATVSELTGALKVVVTEIRRAGIHIHIPAPKKVTGSYAKLMKGAFELPRDDLAAYGGRGPFVRVKLGRKSAADAAPAPTVEPAPTAPATSGLAAAKARGEAAKVQWVRSGEVVPAKDLADAWGITPQALGPAAKRGEVFAVTVKNQRYFPREFLELERDDVSTVCKQLEGLDPSEQLVFWKRKHGSLGGKTVSEALSGKQAGPQLVKVVQLAQALTAQMRADAAASA